MGNHTETIEVDFDPATFSFGDFLDLFWKSHNPFAAARNRQYMTAVFWRSDEQKHTAEAAVARLEEERGAKVTTLILPFESFHLAEGYHQKYRLRRHREFEALLLEAYPELLDFVNSTAAARLNGYLAGYGASTDVDHDLPLLGLNKKAQESLLAIRR